MPPKTHRTAVVIIPPREVWPPIQAIRRVHDRQYRRWMPHITLIYPFRPREMFDTLAPAFARVTAGWQPFSITLKTFRYFRHRRERFTLWLAPEPAEPIEALQEALWHLVPDCDDVRRFPGGFTPHLSVGQVQGRQALDRLMAELQSTWQPVSFTVEAVSFIWRNPPPDDIFRVGCHIWLGPKAREIRGCHPPEDALYKPEG